MKIVEVEVEVVAVTVVEAVEVMAAAAEVVDATTGRRYSSPSKRSLP